MPKPYAPPFQITPAILNQVAEIAHVLGQLTSLKQPETTLRLRRANRIRTIQGSLAIEGNTLSEAHITAILEGKRVIAPVREVQEVRNAIVAYEHLPHWSAHSQKDLWAAHGALMLGLLDRVGCYRTGGVGVMSGDVVIHMAPPASLVPALMRDLLNWVKKTDVHPLIASCVFHYEFEFIHPFADGNGRVGRLWQSLMLSRWHSVFLDVPVESLVHAHQADYYAAIAQSNALSDSTPFIKFMLRMIAEALATLTPQVTPEVTPQVAVLLRTLNQSQREMSRRELQDALGLSDAKNFSARYLAPALAAGLIEMTLPDKPNSRLQRYRVLPLAKLM